MAAPARGCVHERLDELGGGGSRVSSGDPPARRATGTACRGAAHHVALQPEVGGPIALRDEPVDGVPRSFGEADQASYSSSSVGAAADCACAGAVSDAAEAVRASAASLARVRTGRSMGASSAGAAVRSRGALSWNAPGVVEGDRRRGQMGRPRTRSTGGCDREQEGAARIAATDVAKEARQPAVCTLADPFATTAQ